MKNYLLLLTFILPVISAQAQFVTKENRRLFSEKKMGNQMLKSILQKQLSTNNSAQKTTGAMKRLKAHTYVDLGVLEDTTYYVYSGDRGSVHPVNASYYATYNPLTPTDKQYVFCDSMVSSSDYSGQGNMMESKYIYQYDNKGQVSDYISSFSTYIYGYAVIRNSAGLPAEVTISNRSTGNPVNTSRRYYFYDNNNRLLRDSTFNLQTNMPGSKQVYTYDGSGNLLLHETFQFQSNQWVLSYTTAYTYDNSNRVITSMGTYIYTTGIYYSKDSFGYTGSATQYTHFTDFTWDGSGWVNEEMQEYTLTPQGHIASYMIYSWNNNQWDTVENDIYVYDSNGLLQYANGFVYTGNGTFSSTPYDQTTYYYEEYFPTTLSTVSGNTHNISLYPNPAAGNINIDLGELKTAVVSITDITGKAILSKTIDAARSTVNVSHLQKGNYIVTINNINGQRVHQTQFTRL